MTLCQDRLASAEMRAKALQLESSRELETMKSEHEHQLDSLSKRTKEEQDKVSYIVVTVDLKQVGE